MKQASCLTTQPHHTLLSAMPLPTVDPIPLWWDENIKTKMEGVDSKASGRSVPVRVCVPPTVSEPPPPSPLPLQLLLLLLLLLFGVFLHPGWRWRGKLAVRVSAHRSGESWQEEPRPGPETERVVRSSVKTCCRSHGAERNGGGGVGRGYNRVRG